MRLDQAGQQNLFLNQGQSSSEEEDWPFLCHFLPVEQAG